MGHRFAAIAFTDIVRRTQEARGSRKAYSAMDSGEDYNDVLGATEVAFIAARDSFYMASVSETGWPYVQHRGGPTGFVRVLGERTIGFADFRGNRQYISVSNLERDGRVALIFVDYANRARLKIMGRARTVQPSELHVLAMLEIPNHRAAVEQGFVIHVEAFDWNCPQHITPRYTEAEAAKLFRPPLRPVAWSTANGAAPSEPMGHRPGTLELVVAAVRQLTPRVRAYELRDPVDSELPAFEAGAHLRLPVRLKSGEPAYRAYSLCSDPADRSAYQIAVLREDSGSGGSQTVHRDFEIGYRLRCSLPRNGFALHTDGRPALLIAGGIGITPIKSMAAALSARGSVFELHYAVRSEREAAFGAELRRALSDRAMLYSADNGVRMDVDQLLSAVAPDAVVYACGPVRMLDAVARAAARLGIARDRLRIERFVAEIPPDAKPITVALRRSGQTVHVRSDQTILDALLEAGFDAPFSCRAGLCKTCAVPVLAGEPEHRDHALSIIERDRQRLMCPCISRARTDRLVLDL